MSGRYVVDTSEHDFDKWWSLAVFTEQSACERERDKRVGQAHAALTRPQAAQPTLSTFDRANARLHTMVLGARCVRLEELE
jgi:hypothetical protein